jgi:hypothetical protein
MTEGPFGNLSIASFLVANLFSELGAAGGNAIPIAQQNMGLPTSPATFTPATGQWTYTIPALQGTTIFTATGTTASGGITLPSGALQGLPYTLLSTQTITSATIFAPAGFTSAGTTLTAFTANTGYEFELVGTVFYRIR